MSAEHDEPPRTPDGHFIVVGGRRWRATDPAIPAAFRAELVTELMAGRRAVAGALRSRDAEAEAEARARVQDAKVALGERGRAWWEPSTEAADRVRSVATIRALLRHRSGDRSICPSDAARVIGGDRWRSLMPLVRDTARSLAIDGEIEVTAKDQVLPTDQPWRGPIRLRVSRRS